MTKVIKSLSFRQSSKSGEMPLYSVFLPPFKSNSGEEVKYEAF